MAKRSRQVSDDSSDDEAPEAVSFGTSKKVAKGEQDALQQHHAAQKQKRKEKNRALDQALRDRSANTKGTGKNGVVSSGRPSKKAQAAPSEDEGSDEMEGGTKGGASREELEERMARAMMEAEDESGSEEDESFAGPADGVGLDVEDEEMSDETNGSEDEDEEEDEDEDLLAEEGSGGSEDEDEDEEMGSEDEDEDEDEGVSSTKPSSASQRDDYLPDHLFKSALSQASKKIVFDELDPLPAAEASPPRKRKRTKRTSKDVLLGSRIIRTLPQSSAVASSVVVKGLAPPRRVDKFVRTSLNLKSDAAKAKSKGWNRQPANLGVMKRHGPAAHFVRAS